MKKWLYPILALVALGLLVRLPHPARDVAKLEPIRAIYLYMDNGALRIETDTGDRGAGMSLPEAAARMKADTDKEIFLETAEFLILDPAVSVTDDFFTLLRPGCKVVFAAEHPDMKTVSDYLAAHTPKMSLAHLRANRHEIGKELPCTKNNTPSGSLPLLLRRWLITPDAAGSWLCWQP